MRSIRKAAVAGAAAVTMAFGSASVAFAQDDVCSTPTDNVDVCVPLDKDYETDNDPNNPSLSSQIGRSLDRDEGVTGTELFGVDTDLSSAPAWAQAFQALTVVAGLGSLIGLVVGPIYNAIVHG